MKKEEQKTKWLHLRLSEAEQQKLQAYFLKTTCRKLSDYARKKLLEKPIIGAYRNRSQDDLMTELSRLRKELNAVGNNFNQTVKKLHTLHQIAEFRSWLLGYNVEKKIIENKLEEVGNTIKKLIEIWLQ